MATNATRRHGRGCEAAGRTGTQVQFAKIAVMQGHPLETMAFPAVGMPAFVPLPRSADLPTVYAVARQESEFIWHAASGAGAKGLMQMLPSTAVVTARRPALSSTRPPHRRSRFQHPARRGAPGSIDRRPTRLARTRLRRLQRRSGPGRSMDRRAWRSTRWSGRSRRLDRTHSIRRDARLCRKGQRELGVYRQRFAEEKPAPPSVSARVARE